uniref:General odorant binding protein 1 n=1 Tax=Chilo suppressalis TaxID=168631 RepID=C6F017_CHISP|nr:general odorant binding protein 1 [Chilo suppressalis]ACJ07127.1 general odorant binding protein 1 [Chilo suppressalis]ACJ07128.1 general odorant binding protein 1 [Chilo suppressalis]ACJ07129.1 general odorant binding protein 1 [Chilo suppressalis]
MEAAKVIMAGLLVVGVVPSMRADMVVMKDITLGFGAALEHCREESGLTQENMEEFFDFWREDFKFEHRELGCALRCMSRYFNLITDTNRMHHENTENFIKSFPNGEKLSKVLVQVIHECEKKFDHEEDHCWRILHIGECFRDMCRSQNIAPAMEMLLAEFIMQAESDTNPVAL